MNFARSGAAKRSSRGSKCRTGRQDIVDDEDPRIGHRLGLERGPGSPSGSGEAGLVLVATAIE